MYKHTLHLFRLVLLFNVYLVHLIIKTIFKYATNGNYRQPHITYKKLVAVIQRIMKKKNQINRQ